MYTANDIIDHVQKTETYLSGLKDKSPHEKLNHMLTTLVSMVQPVYDDSIVCSVLDDLSVRGHIKNIHPLLFESECSLEKYWVNKIFLEGLSYTSYPYIDCYKALADAEVEGINKHAIFQENAVCFLGSGSMPISMFEMGNRMPDVRFYGVDMDEEAVALSNKINQNSNVQCDFGDARLKDYSAYDVVFMASMVIGKKDVFERISKTARPGTIVAARSVDQLRHILYEPVRVEDVPNDLEYLGKTEYRPEHVNTTLFYRVK